jgi:hypothetical protein
MGISATVVFVTHTAVPPTRSRRGRRTALPENQCGLPRGDYG